MKTDDEVRADARKYWDEYTDLISQGIAKITLSTPRIGMDGKPVKYLPHAAFNFSNSVHIKFTFKALGDTARDYELFFQDSSLELLFEQGNLWAILRKARDKAIKHHKMLRKKLPGRITNLKKMEKELSCFRPKKDYENAIATLEYLQRFSGELIDYLEKEWPASFGLDANLNKDPLRHECWNAILIHLYNFLKDNSPVKNDIYSIMVDLLQTVYPKIWNGKKQDLTENIKTRVNVALSKSTSNV